MLSIIILEDLYRSEYFFLASLWLIFKFSFSESQVSRPWAGPGPAQRVFKLWIQLLEVLINLIRNASVCSNIILKNLYWSEFGFLVSFWLNFHFFVFSNSTYFESEPAQGRLTLWKIWSKVSQSEPVQGRPRAGSLAKLLKFLKLEKKFFVEKYFFLHVLWTSKLFWWKVWIL